MKTLMRYFLSLSIFLVLTTFSPFPIQAQSPLKKIRMSLPSKNVAYLAIYLARDKGFYKQEGIDLELILMPANLASTAVLTGNLDYNGAPTGVIGAAVQDRPMKVLIFTVARPLEFLMSKKEITEISQLRGKKIAGSSPGGTVTMLTKAVLKKLALDPERDVFLNPMGGTGASRLAALDSGVVDAAILEMPENILAQQRGYNELLFLGDFAELPQNGFGTSEKKIRESPDEILKMIRATLRGLQFIWEDKNREEVLDIIMKEWKISDRKMASETFKHLSRVLTKDASVKPESVQFLIDLARESAKVSRPVAVADVVDYSFVEKARKELGLGR
ncbi:MAG: ABC transporter substrate-binding protein [Alphaproteobacteria bacterium]